MPALFLGHGNPIHALSKNVWSEAWQKIATTLPRPKAILAISAHWYLPECAVTGALAPQTIHDFGGFPEALYQVHYPAAGKPELALRVQELLDPLPVSIDPNRGLDHGTWSVLCHLYPKADIPVVQLSIDKRRKSLFHYEAGKRLAILRQEGVLILGSGNLVHNLQAYAWGRQEAAPYSWAVEFDEEIQKLLLAGEDKKLIDYETLGEEARLSIPTPDHYLPLLYVIGARMEKEAVSFPVKGIEGGSVSMLAVQVG